MAIENRLQLIMASNRLNATSFADRIGVQRSNLSHILNGRNKPGYDFLLKVIQSFPNVNAHWLLTGENQISSQEDIIEKTDQNKPQKPQLTTITEDPNRPDLSSEKRVIKTVIFYDDFTFDVFLPNRKA